MRRRVRPCTPCSANTTPAISGLSRGAKNTNQPWSRRSHLARRRCAARVARSPARFRSCPQTSCPAMRARPPVPAAVDDHPQPVVDGLRASPASSSTVDCGGGAGTGFQPLPSSTALTRCGVYARAAVGERRHHDRQRHRRHATCPWPIATEIVSPGVPLLLVRASPSTRSTARGPGARSADRCRSSRRGRAASPTCGSGRRRACCRPCRSTRCTTARSRGAGRPCRGRPSSSTGSSGRRTSRRRGSARGSPA